VQLYDEWSHFASILLHASKDADAVVVGSYFPDAIVATRSLLDAGYGPILFYDIDTPNTVAALRSQGRTDYLDPALIPHYAAYLSLSGGPALRTLEDHFASPRAVSFYCFVDPTLCQRTASQAKYRCDLSYLNAYAPDRQRKLMHYLNGAARLMPLASFVVAGPNYPEWIPWRPNVRHLNDLAPSQHPAFYSSSRFTLNLTRGDMAAGSSPSVRVFEAAACGTAVLCDAWEGMEEFLTPGKEILLPRDEYEVVRILRDMPESETRRIGLAAQERILEKHTADHRAIEFESVVEAARQGGSGPRAPKRTRQGKDGPSPTITL
jgi:spore maturation protein CgeB